MRIAHQKLGPLRPDSGDGRERPSKVAREAAMRAVLTAELCRPRVTARLAPRPAGTGAVQAAAGAYQTKEI